MKKEIEALLFLTDRNLKVEELAEFYEISVDEMRELLKELKEEKKDMAINVKIKNGFVSLETNPLYGEVISRFFNPSVRVKKLSKSSMETLTIIAFKGPITKALIEDIKGVSVDSSIQILLEKKLIHSVGRLQTVGNPKLYEVTENFYGYVGIESKEELMKLDKTNWFNRKSEENED